MSRTRPPDEHRRFPSRRSGTRAVSEAGFFPFMSHSCSHLLSRRVSSFRGISPCLSVSLVAVSLLSLFGLGRVRPSIFPVLARGASCRAANALRLLPPLAVQGGQYGSGISSSRHIHPSIYLSHPSHTSPRHGHRIYIRYHPHQLLALYLSHLLGCPRNLS